MELGEVMLSRMLAASVVEGCDFSVEVERPEDSVLVSEALRLLLSGDSLAGLTCLSSSLSPAGKPRGGEGVEVDVLVLAGLEYSSDSLLPVSLRDIELRLLDLLDFLDLSDSRNQLELSGGVVVASSGDLELDRGSGELK